MWRKSRENPEPRRDQSQEGNVGILQGNRRETPVPGQEEAADTPGQGEGLCPSLSWGDVLRGLCRPQPVPELGKHLSASSVGEALAEVPTSFGTRVHTGEEPHECGE